MHNLAGTSKYSLLVTNHIQSLKYTNNIRLKERYFPNQPEYEMIFFLIQNMFQLTRFLCTNVFTDNMNHKFPRLVIMCTYLRGKNFLPLIISTLFLGKHSHRMGTVARFLLSYRIKIMEKNIYITIHMMQGDKKFLNSEQYSLHINLNLQQIRMMK